MTDLEGLLARRPTASATFDFDRAFPEDDELRGRIAAFANGSGGRLLLGVSGRRLKSGVRRVTAAPGISQPADVAISRLEALLRTIQPPVMGIDIRVVEGLGAKPVIVVHVPPSDAGPHAADGAFRIRRGPEYAEMTAAEIDAAGQRRNDVKRGLAELIASRLASIRSGSAPIAFAERPPLLVVHLVPRAAFVDWPRVDYTRLNSSQQYELRPLRSQKGHASFDDQGLVTTEESDAYTRLLPDGTVEAVAIVPRNVRLQRLIDVNLVHAVRDAVCRYTRVQQAVDTLPPLYLSLALLDSQGYTLGTSGAAVDREVVEVGPAVVYGDPLTALKDVFDGLWQTTGQIECPLMSRILPRR